MFRWAFGQLTNYLNSIYYDWISKDIRRDDLAGCIFNSTEQFSQFGLAKQNCFIYVIYSDNLEQHLKYNIDLEQQMNEIKSLDDLHGHKLEQTNEEFVIKVYALSYLVWFIFVVSCLMCFFLKFSFLILKFVISQLLSAYALHIELVLIDSNQNWYFENTKNANKF